MVRNFGSAYVGLSARRLIIGQQPYEVAILGGARGFAWYVISVAD